MSSERKSDVPKGRTIVWTVGPAQMKALKRQRQAAAERAEREGRASKGEGEPVTDEIDNYRTVFRDAEGRLEELHGIEDRPLWPRDGITLHTANPEGRATMKRAIESLPRRLAVEVEDVTVGSKPRYIVRPQQENQS